MIDKKNYNINYDRLVIWLTELYLRKTAHISWLGILITPIKRMYADFTLFSTLSRYKLSHNSQVVLMQKMLNDSFDDNLRRIRITNSIIHEPVYFHKKQTQKPVYFYNKAASPGDTDKPVYFYYKKSVTQADADFVVEVPSEIKPAGAEAFAQFESLLKSKIDYYKLYSKSYKITYI